jgi:hypothetical protein
MKRRSSDPTSTSTPVVEIRIHAGPLRLSRLAFRRARRLVFVLLLLVLDDRSPEALTVNEARDRLIERLTAR